MAILSQTSFPSGTGPPGVCLQVLGPYPRRLHPGSGSPGYPRPQVLAIPDVVRFFQELDPLQVLGPLGHPWLSQTLSQTPFPPGMGPLAIPDVVTSRYWAPWLSQTPFPPGTGPPGYPRRRFLQVLGPLAIRNVVTSRYWAPWLSQTSLPLGTGPMAIPDVVTSRYWAPWLSLQVLGPPWLSQTPLPPGTRSPGYPRRRYHQVLPPPLSLAITDAVFFWCWNPGLSQTLYSPDSR